jgi:hypothetical protein
MQRQMEPYTRLSFISDVMSRVPSLQSTVSVASAPQPSPIATALGTGIAGLGAYNALRNPSYGLFPRG